MNFLVAYDISDPRRLRQVAKLLETHARRVQKSLFVFTGSRRQLEEVIRILVQEIEPASDRIQAWPIRTSTRANRIDAGTGMPDTGVAAIVSTSQLWIIEAMDDAAGPNEEPLVIE